MSYFSVFNLHYSSYIFFFLHIMIVTGPVIVWQQITTNLRFRFYIWTSKEEKLVFHFFIYIMSVGLFSSIFSVCIVDSFCRYEPTSRTFWVWPADILIPWIINFKSYSILHPTIKVSSRSENTKTWKDTLYALFLVIPRRLKFICRRFGTFCLFHLHRQVDVSRMN